jgi:glycosyltransferase involved in cell wall biosynthesis
MNNPRRSSDFVVVVPFHNEERILPSVIAALRAQTVQHVPVVFIDNASTDGSAALVRACEEVKAGQWMCLEEKSVGKIKAMRTATAYCKERYGTRYVCFLDSDSYPADGYWVNKNMEIVESAGARFGYTYNRFNYFGFDALPVFNEAFLAYDAILQQLMERIAWLANGQGYACSVETLMHYFEKAELTTEVDLRCSLLALYEGRSPNYNPVLLLSSGRRTVVNNRNFAAWCFYEREFYTKKDINAKKKLNLDRPEQIRDLLPAEVPQFFARRAIKITCRHLMPLAIFGDSLIHQKIKTFLGIDVSHEIERSFEQARRDVDLLLTERFDTLIQAIESNPVCLAVAKQIEDKMHEKYNADRPHKTM